jgi:hypothetical protein
MRRHKANAFWTAVMLFAAASAAQAAGEKAAPGVVQSVPPVVASSSHLPPLDLSDAQRSRIAGVLSEQDTAVSFALKNAKSAKSFEPRVGEKIPSGLKGHPLPPPLIYEMPVLKRYTYVKFKDRTLILNPMTHKIVEILPQTGS